LVIVSFNISVSHAYVTTGLIIEKYNFSFAVVRYELALKISFYLQKNFVSFISSSIALSVFTVDPRYLNDLTCSINQRSTILPKKKKNYNLQV